MCRPDVFPDGDLAVVKGVCKVCKLPVSLLILASLKVDGCQLGLSGSRLGASIWRQGMRQGGACLCGSMGP